ncbi:MAG TPA: hypothetical protein VIY68_17755 [Steroidobacteraceae bacterium]
MSKPIATHQNSRLLTEQDIHGIEPERYTRKLSVGRALFLQVTPQGGRS